MRGGKRPGAGAPPGNMNAFKHGKYSFYLQEVQRFKFPPKIRRLIYFRINRVLVNRLSRQLGER